MSDQPPLRIVNFDKEDTGKDDARPTSPSVVGNDRRALSRPDRVCLGLLITALALAPLGAGMFATPVGNALGLGDFISQIQVVGISLVDVLVALALGVAVWREWRRPVAMGPIAGLAGGAILLAAWSGLALLLRRHAPAAPELNAWTSLLAALALGGLVARLGRDRKALLALLLVVVAAGSIAGAIGAREYLEHWRQGEANHRVFGSFNDPNFLAGYLLLTLPLALSCFAASRERLTRLLLGLGVFLQTACLLLTGSRAGVGMLALVIVAWLGLLWRAGILRANLKAVSLGLGLMIVAAGLASVPLLARIAASKSSQAANVSAPTANTTSAGGASAATAAPASASSTGEYSGKFRQYTWIGTIRMARSNPILGTGIGTYETAYPRYAITAYTIHAHNSLLQWTAETGLPGVIFLLVILASSTAFGAYILFLNAPRQRKTTRNNSTDNGSAKEDGGADNANSPLLLFSPSPSLSLFPLPWNFAEPRLLLAGLLASVLSTTLHSLFDSDWYIVATVLTLGAVVGLLSAQARDLAPLATQTPRPLSRAMLAGCGLVALVLLWRGGMTLGARIREAQAQQAITEFQEQAVRQEAGARDSLQTAIDGLRAAAALDPYNVELPLTLGNLYQSQGQPDQARQALKRAVTIAPTGKPLYLLGQFLRRQAVRNALNTGQNNSQSAQLPPDDDPLALSGMQAVPPTLDAREMQAAQNALLRARDSDPHNLQTLRALAETYALVSDPAHSVEVYKDMIALETTPLGTVRAVPERVETDFAFAHARLANHLAQSGDFNEATAEYRQADALLQTYWQRRHYDVYEFLSVEKKRPLNALYDATMTVWQNALKAQAQEAPPAQAAQLAQSLAQVEGEQAAYRQELKADEEAAQEAARKAQAESGGAGGSATP